MAAIKIVESLPEDIVDHPHLRDATELDLGDSNLVALPARIGELTNLETLSLHSCRRLVSLPEGISYSNSLRLIECCAMVVRLLHRVV